MNGAGAVSAVSDEPGFAEPPSVELLRRVLWGSSAASSPVRDRPDDGHEPPTPRDWLLLPSRGTTTLLVPPRGRVGARALFQFNDSMTQRARLAKACVGWAIQAGLAPLAFRDRFTARGARSDGDADLIESELPRILGERRVEVAISLGRHLRPNVKPVLQIMAPDGRVLAFAKLAWNRLTTELVRNETATLRRLDGLAIRSFRVPQVLHHGRWNGFDLVVLSPLPHGLLRRSSVNALPPSRVIREVASLGPESREALIGGPYWQRISRRAVDASVDVAGSSPMAATVAEVARRWSDVEVVHGMSHGDFAPWNMLHTDRSLGLWDWERASGSRPLGVDALHFCFEVAYQKEGRHAWDAIDVALERSGGVLTELGVDRHAAEAIRDVYTLERLTRLLEGRKEGVAVDDGLADALSGSLERDRGTR